MNKREEYYREFTQITAWCFDIMKFQHHAEHLNVSVWVNFRGLTYFSGDILCDPHSFCEWNGEQWVFKRGIDVIKLRGVQQILDFLEKNYNEETGKASNQDFS